MFQLEKNDPILITGGSGFVGSHLIELLQANAYSNITITSTKTKNVPGVSVKIIDLTDANQTLQLMTEVNPKAIFHLASMAEVGNSFENQAQLYKNNGAIQQNVLEAVRIAAPKARVVSISSAQVYGKSNSDDEIPITEQHEFRPLNPYAVSKVHQDALSYMYYAAYGLNIVRVRPFNHVGERQTNQFVIASLAEQIVKIERGIQPQLSVGNIDNIRDFTDVKDVVIAYELLLREGVAGEAYNVGSGLGISIAEIVDIFTELAKKEIIVTVDESRLRQSDIPVMIANIEKIQKLGWQPSITLKSTIRRILDYWRDRV